MLELKIGLTGSYNNSNGGIVELLTPTFFQEKLPIRGQKLFYVKKKYGEVVLNWRTNDQVMPRFGRSFINYI